MQTLKSLHLDDNQLRIIDDKGSMWTEQRHGVWQSSDAPQTIARLTTTVNNDLMTWRCVKPGSYEIRISALPSYSPTFGNRGEKPGLLTNGVFLFDDVRDARQTEDTLLVATRGGMWEYDQAALRSLVTSDQSDSRAKRCRIPLRGTLLAPVAANPGRPDPSLELSQFVADHRSDEIRILDKSGTVSFVRQPDKLWKCEAGPMLKHPDQSLQVSSHDGPCKVSVQHNRIVIETDSAGPTPARIVAAYQLAMDDTAKISGSLVTPTSIWIPVKDGVVWVRRDQLPR
jgi:hypothetical protein